MNGISDCPVCNGQGATRDGSCGFCMGFGRVSGAWRENLADLEANGTWVGTSATHGESGEQTGRISRVVRKRDSHGA